MEPLPVDVINQIFGFLTARDLSAASWVCRAWRSELTRDGGMWSRVYKETWPVIEHPLISSFLAASTPDKEADPTRKDFICRAHNSYWRHNRVKTATVLQSASYGDQRIWRAFPHPAVVLSPPWMLISQDVPTDPRNPALWIFDLRKPHTGHAWEGGYWWSNWISTDAHSLRASAVDEDCGPVHTTAQLCARLQPPRQLIALSYPFVMQMYNCLSVVRARQNSNLLQPRVPPAMSLLGQDKGPFVLQARGCRVLFWHAQEQLNQALCSSILPAPVLAVALEENPRCPAGDSKQACFIYFAAACYRKVQVWAASCTHDDGAEHPQVNTSLVWESAQGETYELTSMAIWASEKGSNRKNEAMNLALGLKHGIQVLCLAPGRSDDSAWSIRRSVTIPLGAPARQICVTWDAFPQKPQPPRAKNPASGSSPLQGSCPNPGTHRSQNDACAAQPVMSRFSTWRLHVLLGPPEPHWPPLPCRVSGKSTPLPEAVISNPKVTQDSLASTLARMRVEFRNADPWQEPPGPRESRRVPAGAVGSSPGSSGPCLTFARGKFVRGLSSSPGLGTPAGPAGGTGSCSVSGVLDGAGDQHGGPFRGSAQGVLPAHFHSAPCRGEGQEGLPATTHIVCLRASAVLWPPRQDGGLGQDGEEDQSVEACAGPGTLDSSEGIASGNLGQNLTATRKAGEARPGRGTTRRGGDRRQVTRDNCMWTEGGVEQSAGDNPCWTGQPAGEVSCLSEHTAGDDSCWTEGDKRRASFVAVGVGDVGEGAGGRGRALRHGSGGEQLEVVWRKAAPSALHISVGDGLLALGCDNGHLLLWDAATGCHVRRVPNVMLDSRRTERHSMANPLSNPLDCRVWVGDLGCGGPAAHLLSLTETPPPIVRLDDGLYSYDMRIVLHAVSDEQQVRCKCGDVAKVTYVHVVRFPETPATASTRMRHQEGFLPYKRRLYLCGRRRGQRCNFHEYID